MRRMSSVAIAAVVTVTAAASAQAQRAPRGLRRDHAFLVTAAPVIALTHVKLIDGTGAAPKNDQTIVIENGRITAVGASAQVKAPANAQVMDLTGHTVIPGLVGMHDHLYYTAAGGRAAQ